MPTWLITGCSSGLGRHLSQAVLERGWNAVVTARDRAKVQDIAARYPDTALALVLDVADRAQVAEAVRRAEAKFGAVEVLVNNAGHGYRSAVEEADEAEVDELFASNFFGAVRMIKAVLPGMRARRRGTIVNLSSIAARNPGPGSAYYAATKCAVEGLSGGLRKEVEPLGVKVIVVEPGEFRTDFSGRSLHQSRTAIADYADTAGRRRIENDKTHGHQRGDPARGAQVMVGAALDADRATLEAWRATSLTTDFPA
jgi:NADP-dependent 3-hydroxy acid dehydrogenase YdfG